MWLWVTGQVPELNQGLLEEQQEILTTETSCWPHQISDTLKKNALGTQSLQGHILDPHT